MFAPRSLDDYRSALSLAPDPAVSGAVLKLTWNARNYTQMYEKLQVEHRLAAAAGDGFGHDGVREGLRIAVHGGNEQGALDRLPAC